VRIDRDGTVSAQLAGDELPSELGQITLVRTDDPTKLQRLDGGLYRAPDDVRLIDVAPGEDGGGTIVQAMTERSNVEITSEMVTLLLVQRAYAASAQVVQAADELMAIANGLRR